MDAVSSAFEEINRENFIPLDLRRFSDEDRPLPIGFNQTISQPTTVKMMLNWLEAKPGDKVLDVGSGSGWTTALLGHITKPGGRVFALEIIPELIDVGKQNCNKSRVNNIEFFLAEPGTYGLADHAPYDRILVSAAAKEIPDPLLDQLKIGGKLVIPVHTDILEIARTSKTVFKTIVHPGFVFVPLI